MHKIYYNNYTSNDIINCLKSLINYNYNINQHESAAKEYTRLLESNSKY